MDVVASDLENCNSRSTYFKTMFLAFHEREATDWRSQLIISLRHKGAKHSIQFHHIFPQKVLKSHDLPDNKINDICNLAFISGETNRKISDKEPSIYLPEIVGKMGQDALTKQSIPTDLALWKVEAYDDFLARRREMVAKRLNEFLGRLPGVVATGEAICYNGASMADCAKESEKNLPAADIAVGGKCPYSGDQIVYVRAGRFYMTRDSFGDFAAIGLEGGEVLHAGSDGREVICEAMRMIGGSNQKNKSDDEAGGAAGAKEDEKTLAADVVYGGKCPKSSEPIIHVRADCFYVTRSDGKYFTARNIKNGEIVHVHSDGRELICDVGRLLLDEWKNSSNDEIAGKIQGRMRYRVG